MDQLVQELLEDLQPLAQRKQVSFLTQLTNPIPPVELDPSLIIQVWYNLLTNAIRFAPENSAITIQLASMGNYLQCSIKDQGKGIPAESLELIFDKFYQAPNQTLKKPEGSGLGLAISKKIIELHNGTIHAENSEQGGACFIFTLPISKTSS
jgi:signal transduction histidine kinase